MKKEIFDLLNEFEGILQVSDLGIVISGTRIDYLRLNYMGDVEFWAGNPDEDDYAEEIILNDRQVEDVFTEILEIY